MDIELTYHRGLWRRIGDVDITYGRRAWLDSRPRGLGAWTLEYDSLGSRLRAVGDAEITYRRWSNQPLTVGGWTCEHSRFGARLLRIGPHELRYNRLGSRVCGVGPLEVLYDRFGSRPIRVRLGGGAESLTGDLLLALFLALYWQEEAWEAARRSRS
ncbi:hypothetical protein ACF068_28770 [Streptomyces sp. NPDC016309]|uniref:hypothetical protein n=1 Tax=Streptomyces sp. NPDC016309 TaxID=3364965 RepID=UPI003701BBAE